MVTPKVSIREFRRSDLSSFVELCESRDGLDAEDARRRASVVEHIAFNNPDDDGNPTYIIAVQGDKVVAHLGRMPTQFCVNGRIESGSYFHDLYVHPDVRKVGGQGFFLSMKLYQAAEKASQGFVAMIWTNEINIALQQARSYEQMWTRRLVKLLSLDEKIDKFAPAWARYALKPIARSAFRCVDAIRDATTKKLVSIEQIERFDSRFDELAEAAMRTTAIAPYKSSAYLNWKYVTRPALRATILAAIDSNNQLRGYSVIVDPDPDFHSAPLAELVVPDDDPVILRNLLDSAIRSARAAGAGRIAAVATHGACAATLKSRLFTPRGPRDPLFVALADQSSTKEHILDISNWHMSLGDSEGPF